MQFVIRIRVESAETVTAGVIRIAAADGIGTHILEKNNTARKGTIGLVRHHAADRAELGLALLVLSYSSARKHCENQRQTADASPHIHPLPPAVGCIRNTKFWSFAPVFVSMMRVCSE